MACLQKFFMCRCFVKFYFVCNGADQVKMFSWSLNVPNLIVTSLFPRNSVTFVLFTTR